MLAEERKQVILKIVNERKAVRVTDLSNALSITEATVRRDLDELQSEHKIRRTHGGALSIYPAAYEWNVKELIFENQEEKRAIAAKAYEYIDDRDALILDNSTTVRELVKLLKSNQKKDLTIVTASFNIVSDLVGSVDYEIIHLGGIVRPKINGTVGPIAERALQDLHVDKAILGVNGVSTSFGYSVPGSFEASLKKLMIQSAKQTIVLADHTKFGKSYLCRIAPIEGADYLITDSVAPETKQELLDLEVNYVLA